MTRLKTSGKIWNSVRKRKYPIFFIFFSVEYDREMINGKLDEINKKFTDKIQSQTEAITAQV